MTFNSKLNFYKKKYRSILANSGSLFSIKTIDLVLGFWMIPFLIWKVGLHNYGIYAFAMALGLFFVNLLNYGFNLSAVRKIAKSKKDPTELSKIFNDVFGVKLFLILILYPIYLLLIYYIPEFSQYKLLYFYSSLLMFGDLFSLRWFFMGIEKMKFIALIHLIGTSIYVVLVFFFIENPLDYYKIPFFQFIGMVFTSVVSFIWVVKNKKIKMKLIPLSRVIYYLKMNFSSFVNLLLPSTYGSIIVFVVGWIGLPVQVSFMHIGMKFTAAFSSLNTVLTNVFFPIANRKKNSLKQIRLALNRTGFLMSLLMFVSATFLVEYWLKFESQDYLEKTILVLQFLSPIPFLIALVSSYGVNGLLVSYRDILFGKITLFSVLIMVVLSVVLIPKTLFLGGAIAFIIGRLIHALLSLYFFKYKKEYAG